MTYAKRSSVRLAHLLHLGRALLVNVANLKDDRPLAAAKTSKWLRDYKPEEWLKFRDELRYAWPHEVVVDENMKGRGPGAVVTKRTEPLNESWLENRDPGEGIEQWVAEYWLDSEPQTVRVHWAKNKLIHPNLRS